MLRQKERERVDCSVLDYSRIVNKAASGRSTPEDGSLMLLTSVTPPYQTTSWAAMMTTHYSPLWLDLTI